MKLLLPTEYDECVALAAYLDTLQTQKKILRYTHIPNETYTKSWHAKMKNKRQGVRPGFPDYVILFPNTILFLEMKRKKGGALSQEQKEWLLDLAKFEEVAICYGFDEAKKLIDSMI